MSDAIVGYTFKGDYYGMGDDTLFQAISEYVTEYALRELCNSGKSDVQDVDLEEVTENLFQNTHYLSSFDDNVKALEYDAPCNLDITRETSVPEITSLWG